MSGTGRTNLSLQGGGPDSLWFQNPANPFLPRKWNTIVNHIHEYFDLSPSSNASTYAFGNQIKFEIDKRLDKLGKIELILTRSAVTGATNPAFVDWEPYRVVESIRFKYNNKYFHEIYGEELLIDLLQTNDEDFRDAQAQMGFGKKTLAERRVLAANTNTWLLDLQCPWENVQKHIPMICLPNKIEVEVNLRPLNRCIEYTAATTPVCTISNPILRIQGVHLPQAQRLTIFNLAMNGAGYAVKTLTKEYHLLETVASGGAAGRTRIRLRNLKNTSVKLNTVLRLQTDLDTLGSINPWNFQQSGRFWMEDSGAQVTYKVPMADYTGGIAPLYWGYYSLARRCHPKGELGLYVGVLPFCAPEFVESAKDDVPAGRSIFRYNNPELVHEFDAAWSAMYCDVWSFVHNLIIIQKGDIRKFLI